MRDIIIIAGDSWGAGEWTRPESGGLSVLSHHGLKYYLEEKNQKVINLSKWGGSNLEGVLRVFQFIKLNPEWADKLRCIIFFQTEWPRDICDSWHMSTEVKTLSIQDCKSRWLARFQIRLSEIARELDIQIYLIGGASDTDWFETYEQEYPGLKIACQSMTNFLIHTDHRVQKPQMTSTANTGSDFLQMACSLLSHKLSPAEKRFVLNEIKDSEDRNSTWSQHPEWFWPDGTHANKKGHQKLFDFLCDTIPKFII